MKTSLWASGVVALILLTGCRSGGKSAGMASLAMDFEGVPLGEMPAGWRIAETNAKGTPATWRVIADVGAPSGGRVFALTETANSNGTYNLAIADGSEHRDFALTVKVLAVSGEEDQGGGPIWRCRDADNYYVCRINPLEITCDLDGEPMLEAEDGDLPDAGMIGLWTKADAVTSFDDLTIQAAD